MSIEIKNIKKSYNSTEVLNDISFSIEACECFCLLGRNGAGKTTLINIMCDFIPPDSGMIKYDGLSFSKNELEIKQRLGVHPEIDPTIPELTGYQYLQFVSRLHDIPESESEIRIQHLLNIFLDNHEDAFRRIGTYSRGMRLKISLCASFIHNPQYVLLDEPFANLDPVSAHKLVKYINKLCSQGAAILVSSHNLNYVEQIAHRVGILERTQLKFVGTLTELSRDDGKIEKSLLNLLKLKKIEKF